MILLGYGRTKTRTRKGRKKKTIAETMKTLKTMKVNGLSIELGRLVVVRIGRDLWHVGEAGGDWLCQGNAKFAAERVIRQ